MLVVVTPVFAWAQVPTAVPAPVTTPSADQVFQTMQMQQNAFLQWQQQQQVAAANAALEQQNAQVKATQTQGLFTMFAGLCPMMFGGSGSSKTAMGSTGDSLEDAAYELQEAAWAAREKEGFVYEKDLDRNTSRTIGQDASATFAKGCDHFINKEGQLGSWGSYTLQQIKDKPESFGANVPDDITQWCPNYPKMNKDQRELYWVWIIMSMASSESSCNPRNDNRNAPNGTAIGLLQVWKPVCPKARDLHVPYQNIQCGVDLLAKELQNRDTLMTPTSKGPEGTYWGPLRSDDWNKRRGGDIDGAQKTRALMSQYRYCK
ncbi:hypothetical protein QJS83_01485 [Bdellovibrio sp. 22V]|uniref:hypothetical protein n=1 Tax=Bdellovibrio TaxID=958 RepID=UPI002543E440|nr:hypothetical protein [Bdellovibrio sp. 22V]WII72541.1 hypothetical protein QJS83_01485 [Bdellovibrio sp. 22V]